MKESLKKELIGSTITKINLFQVNVPIFEIKHCDRQPIDGGIEFHLDNNRVLTFGWSSEYEIHVIAFDQFSNLFTHDLYLTLEASEDHFWKQVVNNKIEDVDIKWTWFEDLQGKVHHIPHYLDFRLSLGSRFMVGAMDFNIENNDLIDLCLDPHGWIITFFNPDEIEKIKEESKLH